MSFERWCASLGLALLATAAMAAPPPSVAKDNAVPPPPQPLRPLHFPAFEEHALANGLKVVLIEQHAVPFVSFRLLVPAGKLYVPAAKAGLSEAVAGLLTQGTASRTAPDIAGTIDAVGGTLAASAGADFALLSAHVTSDQFDLALDLLTDVALHPSFPDEELNRWRSQALSELALRDADGSYLADIALQRMVYGQFPYGLPRLGTPASIAALQRADLVAFHQRHYIPNSAILTVVGDIQPAAALAKLERAFAGWQRGEDLALPPFPAAASTRRILVLDKPDAVQTQIRVGGIGIAFSDPDLVVERVYDAILGGDSNARLFQEIREKRALTYGADSGFAEDLQPGLFRTATYTKTASTVQTLQVMLDVIDGLAKAPPTVDECDAKKANLIGAFPLNIETADGIASDVVDALAHGKDRAFLEHYRELVGAVTPAQVQAFARHHLRPEHSVVVLVGNMAAFAKELRGQVGAFMVIGSAAFDPLADTMQRPPAH